MLKPLIIDVIKGIADKTAVACLVENATTIYETLTEARDVNWFTVENLIGLAPDIIQTLVDAGHWRSCVYVSGFYQEAKEKALSSVAKTLLVLEGIKLVDSLTLAVISQYLNAPPLVSFDLTTCVPSCNGVTCGDDHCGGRCPDACPQGSTCDYANLVCKGACEQNFCQSHGFVTGAHCDGSNKVVCTSMNGCSIEAARSTCANGCSGGACVADPCSNGMRDGSETGVDCGGPQCAKCVIGQPCGGNGDCASGYCAGGTCQVMQQAKEACNLLDDDGDGVIDNDENCWVGIYRFWDQSNPASPRCYGNSPVPPVACAGYTLEYPRVFFLSAVQVPGTVALVAYDKGIDHVLIRETAYAEIDAVENKLGYTKRGTIGYIWVDEVNPPAGSFYQPANATTSKVRDLRRYYNPMSGIHLFANNPVETAPSWQYEGVKGYVWSSRW